MILGAAVWRTLCEVRDLGRKGLPQTDLFFDQELMDTLMEAGFVTRYRDRYFITEAGRAHLQQ